MQGSPIHWNPAVMARPSVLRRLTVSQSVESSGCGRPAEPNRPPRRPVAALMVDRGITAAVDSPHRPCYTGFVLHGFKETEMANLTITVDEKVLRKARLRALETGTSVNAFLRSALESFAGAHHEQLEALSDLLELSRSCSSGRGGRTWTRDQLHERTP